jgi:hypothetical protein
MSVPKLLIIFGLVLVAVGLLWPLIARTGIGRLPGDIVIERDNFRLYVPLATSLLISVVLSVFLWLLNRWTPWVGLRQRCQAQQLPHECEDRHRSVVHRLEDFALQKLFSVWSHHNRDLPEPMRAGVIMLNYLWSVAHRNGAATWKSDKESLRRSLAAVTAIQVITAFATAKNMRERKAVGFPVIRDKGAKATAKVTAAAGEKERVLPVPSENRGSLGMARTSIDGSDSGKDQSP